MKKSLSLIVALAMVVTLLAPAMAFAATQEQNLAGERLEKYGILKGDGQGNLLLDDPLPREHMMVMLARLFGQEEEARNTPNTHGWSDVEDPYYHGFISWAKNEGLTKGVGDGSKFGYKQILNIQSLLQLSLRALGYNDVAWEDVRAKSIELGLISADVDVTRDATRGDMAVVTLATLGTPVNGSDEVLGAVLGIEDFIEDEVVGDAKIASFKAVGNKKLAVEFEAPVDTSKADIVVKRGTNTVSLASVEWSADNKTATITTVSRLFEGTYTVNVSGLTEEVLAADVNVQNEFVAAIEFTDGDVVAEPRDNKDTLKLGYKVYNQYGEEYNSAPLNSYTNVADATISATGGVIEISYADYNSKPGNTEKNFKKDDVVYVALHSQDAGVNISKSFKIGEEARAVDLKIIGLHHDDNKTLDATVDKDAIKGFKLIIEVYDQYGNRMTNATHLNNDVAVYINGRAVGVSDIKSGKVKDNDNTTYVELTANEDGKVEAGQATIIVMTKFATASAQYVVNVLEGQIIDQVVVNPVGDLVAAGEEVKVPITAIDKEGNLVNDPDKLGGVTLTVSGPYDSNDSDDKANEEFIKDGDNLFIKFKAPKKDGVVYVSVISETNKPSNTFVTIREKAYPKVLVGLSSDQNVLIYDSESIELNNESFVAEDQYGRRVSKDTLNNMLGDGYKIEAYATDGDQVSIDQNKLTNSAKIKLGGAKKGEQEIFFRVLDKSDKPISGSEMSAVFRTVVIDEIESLEVNNVATIFAHAKADLDDYDREVKVTGITSDGKKVTLPNRTYNLFYADYAQYDENTGKLRVVFKDDKALNDKFGDKSELSFTLRVVTEGGKGLTATQNVVTSKNAPGPNSIEIKDDDKVITSAKFGAGKVNLGEILNKFKIIIKDQYGVEANMATKAFPSGHGLPSPFVTFTNVEPKDKDNPPVISKNGFEDAEITAKSGDKFKVTIQYGSASVTLDVEIE